MRKGIDYAVGVKLGIVEKTYGKAVDIGKLAHAHLLGGEQEFVVSPYADFKTKEARVWRDEQSLPIVSDKEFEIITKVAERIKSHDLARDLIFGKNAKREVELKAKIDGMQWVGRADVLGINSDKTIEYILDIKTTAQFDDFKWTAKRNDYDLQVATYSLIANAQNKPFYWVIAETVAPYRVGVAVSANEFAESGYRKLETICAEIRKFNDRAGASDLEKINFNLNKSMDDLLVIGDWSI